MPSTQNGIPTVGENDGIHRRDALMAVVASLAALPGAAPLAVSFTDGVKLTVPPHALAEQ